MIFTKNWWKAMAVRLIKTGAQVFAGSLVGISATLGEVNWIAIASSAAVACVASFFTSLAGLPEVNEKTGEDNKEG